jgi:glycosyltransferase involved in cell wall biosynthesis
LEILVFHDPEGTIASVRNELANQAKGGWLLFLDADDELAPGYLSAMATAYAREREYRNAHFLLTPAVQYVRKGRPRPPTFLDRGIPLTDDNWLVVGTLIQRELFLEVGGFGDYPHGFEDFSLWSKAWRIGAQVVKVPKAVYICHVNLQSKHKIGWRDKKWQVATHHRVIAELNEWEAAR